MGKIKMNDWEIIANQRIAQDTWKIILTLSHGKGEEGLFAWPGQFVNIKIDEKYLRRPISVCDFDQGKLTLIYKVVGSGTAWLADRKPGEKLNLLYPLGNGFDTNAIDNHKKNRADWGRGWRAAIIWIGEKTYCGRKTTGDYHGLCHGSTRIL